MFHRNVNSSRTREGGDANLMLDATPGKICKCFMVNLIWTPRTLEKNLVGIRLFPLKREDKAHSGTYMGAH